MIETANDTIDHLIDNEKLPDNCITKEEAKIKKKGIKTYVLCNF